MWVQFCWWSRGLGGVRDPGRNAEGQSPSQGWTKAIEQPGGQGFEKLGDGLRPTRDASSSPCRAPLGSPRSATNASKGSKGTLYICQ